MGGGLDDMGQQDLLMLESLGRRKILVVVCRRRVDCIDGDGGLHLTERERWRGKMYLELL